MNKKVIYLDNAATTKTRPEVVEAMLPYFTELYGNPSSVYGFASQNKEAVTVAREQIAKALNAPTQDIYFTAGGSESDNWALKAAMEAYKDKGNHLITTKIEHHAILHTCEYLEKNGCEVTYLDVDENGVVKLEDLKEGMEYNQNINFENYVQKEVHVGIDGIELKDEMIFGINQRDNNHETSIYKQNINVTNKLNNLIKTIFLVIIIILAIVFIISVIIYLIKNKNTNNQQISIKHITIIASMATILFVQEQLLTFIPNVQLTFLLISLYTVVFGFKKTSLIIFIHILLDNIVMGSFNPIVMLPMYIGYELCSLLVYLVNDKNLVLITIMASIGSVIYCLAFMVANAFFLNIDILAYYVADIPFEIILIISTILSIMYLFRPLEKVLRKQWESI
mgnify:CR=1 FL=1